MLSELVRILRPGGYLIIREHDCRKERSLQAKYLNFIHAFMMIARVGEFGYLSNNRNSEGQNEAYGGENHTMDWQEQKCDIIKYTSTIQYRIRDEWTDKLVHAGFHHKITLEYDPKKSRGNPQALYYAVYQLPQTKKI